MLLFGICAKLNICAFNPSLRKAPKRYSETNSKIENVENNVDSLSVKLRKEIKIEGLKSEKRAIQASDRKILDVNRQTEIDQEISKLEK